MMPHFLAGSSPASNNLYMYVCELAVLLDIVLRNRKRFTQINTRIHVFYLEFLSSDKRLGEGGGGYSDEPGIRL